MGNISPVTKAVILVTPCTFVTLVCLLMYTFSYYLFQNTSPASSWISLWSSLIVRLLFSCFLCHFAIRWFASSECILHITLWSWFLGLSTTHDMHLPGVCPRTFIGIIVSWKKCEWCNSFTIKPTLHSQNRFCHIGLIVAAFTHWGAGLFMESTWKSFTLSNTAKKCK